jgi:hypothetical protein
VRFSDIKNELYNIITYMTKNIFKVTGEDDLTEILQDNKNKLVTIMISARWHESAKTSNSLKQDFIQLSKRPEFRDVFFVYIDIDNYEDDLKDIKKSVVRLPTFVFYYFGDELTRFDGANLQKLCNTIVQLQSMIATKNKEKEASKNQHVIANQTQAPDLMQLASQLMKMMPQPVQQVQPVHQMPIMSDPLMAFRLPALSQMPQMQPLPPVQTIQSMPTTQNPFNMPLQNPNLMHPLQSPLFPPNFNPFAMFGGMSPIIIKKEESSEEEEDDDDVPSEEELKVQPDKKEQNAQR